MAQDRHGARRITACSLGVFLALAPIFAAAQQAPSQKAPKDSSPIAKMAKKVDKLEGVSWYKDKSTPQSTNRNSFHLYIGQKGTHLWLRLRVQYASDSWLFVQRFLVVADGRKFERSGRFERDHHRTIWEWYDENVTKADLEMIRAIASSKEAAIRLYGRQYRDDRKISSQEKAALRNVLEAYSALGGKEPLR